jgi:hypothetical protein
MKHYLTMTLNDTSNKVREVRSRSGIFAGIGMPHYQINENVIAAEFKSSLTRPLSLHKSATLKSEHLGTRRDSWKAKIPAK